ncbi:MAG: hypothetical protein U5J63_05805 [Fodinibius sp.]|nr:hypothetical protein [Fodinibius sp.]
MKQIICWIIGGVLLTTVAFFIPEQAGSMWPSLMAASIVASAYLVLIFGSMVESAFLIS